MMMMMITIMIISIKASSWVSSHHVTERWDGRVIITEYKINFINLYVSVTQRELVLLLRAKNNQNCSFCDKSMKLPRMTNLYKVNIF